MSAFNSPRFCQWRAPRTTQLPTALPSSQPPSSTQSAHSITLLSTLPPPSLTQANDAPNGTNYSFKVYSYDMKSLTPSLVVCAPLWLPLVTMTPVVSCFTTPCPEKATMHVVSHAFGARNHPKFNTNSHLLPPRSARRVACRRSCTQLNSFFCVYSNREI